MEHTSLPIDPFFLEDSLKFTDRRFFPGYDNSFNASYSFPIIVNSAIKNEIRWFIQKRNNDGLLPSTLYADLTGWCRVYSDFINTEPIFKDVHSITEISRDEYLEKFIRFINKRGLYSHNKIKNGRLSVDGAPAYINAKSRRLRLTESIYDSLIGYYSAESDISEYDKDIWRIDKLDVSVQNNLANPKNYFNFSNVSVPFLKELSKEMAKALFKTYSVSRIQSYIRAAAEFSAFIQNNHPEVVDYTGITRSLIEEYLKALRKKPLNPNTFNLKITSLGKVLSFAAITRKPGMTLVPLIVRTDHKKKYKKAVHVYSANELRQINSHITSLNPVYARLLIFIELQGTRISDTCTLPMLLSDGRQNFREVSGTYYLDTMQVKTRETTTIPLEKESADIIASQIAYTHDQYGESAEYIFASAADKPLKVETVRIVLQKWAVRNHLLSDDGTPLRIGFHRFRKTVASELINSDGISIIDVATVLGHANTNSLAHYIRIDPIKLHQLTQFLRDESDERISHFGDSKYYSSDQRYAEENNKTPDTFIPLSIGYCSKPIEEGICDSANHCYFCRMFVPTVRDIAKYRSHLARSEASLASAKLNGFDILIEQNEKVIARLKEIISELEKGDPS